MRRKRRQPAVATERASRFSSGDVSVIEMGDDFPSLPPDTAPIREAEADSFLAPTSPHINCESVAAASFYQPCEKLADTIRQRIDSRLGGRIRDLAVYVYGKRVVLRGCCATYYTKQLAQHAAFGVIEDEHVENEIVVAVST